MNFKINNKTGSPVKYEKEIHSLCDFAQQRLGFDKPPSIFLNHDKRNAGNTLGKTGYYDPNTMEIHVFATGRHPKDILRSIAHELVHHNQHMNGELDMHGYSGKGYAQKNPKLRKSEMEANDPMLFRDWEDSIKEKENTIYNERRIRKMSFNDWKNKELSENLNKKWGFKMDLGKLNEAHCGKRDDDSVDEAHCAGKRDDGKKEETIEEAEENKKSKVPAGLAKYQAQQKAKKKGKEEGDEEDNTSEKSEEGEGEKPKKGKPDFLDLDGDGDKKEPMKQAAKQAKKESLNKEQIVNEVMRRVAKRISSMKKGRK
tara:strand:- start:501 stop:1442 length:942 start_codon:yes stop_codon:yes gene_type:complete